MFKIVLQKLHHCGVNFIITSGRSVGRLNADFSEFINSVDFVADNGAVLVHNGHIIRTTCFSKKCILNFIDYLHEKYPDSVENVLVSGIKHSYFLKKTANQYKKSHYYFYPNSIEIDNFNEIPVDDQYTKITVDYPSKIRHELEAEFNSRSTEKNSC